MRVADVMTRNVVSVTPQATLSQAIDAMVRAHISGLPVIAEDGRLAGILSEGDLLRRPELGTEKPRASWFSALFKAGHLAQAYAQTHGRRVDDIMTRDVVVVDQNERIEEAVLLMEQHGIKRLPVVEDGRVIGLLSRADLVRVLAEFLRQPYEEQPVGDKAILAAIQAELEAQPWAPAGSIRMEVHNGVVELSGAITDENQRNAVRIIAENTPGVQSVRDNLLWIEPMTGIVLTSSETSDGTKPT
ncbi:CBS domain-containing protein [Labrys sp. KB_33_2]|uniref:CBS domain-containing protein n=1 Tax=Labrys sp. KB_33_2 TaxID=3237479 RepID=UPI003F91899D